MPSSLLPGSKLGRYEIRSPLGSGGMGEVYLAFDSALNRKVALKILPEEFANKPLAMQRFVQEAKAASGLNHPNIITIYEIGTEPGTHYIATEFIDGETLRRHLSRGEVSIGKAIDVALQVASALSTAHAAGIIHRDIKPENIMLRRDGIVKVLDFGLAKLTERWNADEVDPDAATKAIVQTQPGLIVGTTAYMSPEQTRAVEIDTRTDIWSLGIMLYELIAGRTPFRGETASDTSAAILKSEPAPLYEILPDIPFELERIVRKALQKDREERYQVVKDFELDLKALKRSLDLGNTLEPSLSSRAQMSQGGVRTTGSQAASRHSTTVGIDTSADRRARPGLITLIAALAVIALGGCAFLLWQQLSSKSFQPSNLTVTHLTSRKNELGESATNHARFSPDGKFIVYASAKDGASPIWLKQLGGGDPFTNRSAEGVGASPIWSPNGQEIAFLSRREGQNGIWRMPAFGGAPILIKNLERPSRGLVSWSKTGQIYFVSQGNLYSLQVDNQQVTPVTNFDPAKPVDRSFSVSQDEQQIAYSDIQDGQSDIWVVPRTGGQSVKVTNDKYEDGKPVWTPENKGILYSSKRNGLKQIFLSYLDDRQPVQLTINDNNTDVLDVSVDGTKILYATTREESDLWSVSIDQPKESQLTSDAGIELWPDVSPDGKSVAFQSLPTNSGLSLFGSLPQVKSLISDTALTQLAPDGFALRWSPNGKQVAFLRQSAGTPNLWTVHASGGDAKPLTTEGVAFGGYAYLPYNRVQTNDFEWSADGSSLIYCARDGGKMNVWQVTADGSSRKQLSNNEDHSILFFNPTMSTDGKTVAWLALMPSHAAKKNATWSIWMAEEGIARQVLESDSVVGIVGWSESNSQLMFKTIDGANSSLNVPVDVKVFLVDKKTAQQRMLSELKAAYFPNVHLSPSRNAIAFVTRQDGPDSLRLISTKGGAARTILTSNDPRVYFSFLNWSPDGKSILYGKQSTWTTFSMLDNFTSN